MLTILGTGHTDAVGVGTWSHHLPAISRNRLLICVGPVLFFFLPIKMVPLDLITECNHFEPLSLLKRQRPQCFLWCFTAVAFYALSRCTRSPLYLSCTCFYSLPAIFCALFSSLSPLARLNTCARLLFVFFFSSFLLPYLSPRCGQK